MDTKYVVGHVIGLIVALAVFFGVETFGSLLFSIDIDAFNPVFTTVLTTIALIISFLTGNYITEKISGKPSQSWHHPFNKK